MNELFSGDGYYWFEQRLVEVTQQIDAIPGSDVYSAPDDTASRLIDRSSVEPIILLWEDLTRDEPREDTVRQMDFWEPLSVRAHSVDFFVPFTGDPILLQLRASTRSLGGRPDGRIVGNQITFRITVTDANPEQLMGGLERVRKSLIDHVSWINNDAAKYNERLTAAVKNAVELRKQRLDQAHDLSAALNIPIRKSPEAARVSIPVVRKQVRPTEGRPRQAGPSPEPSLSDEIYEDVLRTMRATANSFERLPQTADRFNEEELRDVLLFILNSNYEGAVAGEVFNGAGKTDILLRHQDRNAFIGECKIWHGEKQFSEAIDQLLSYTVWRDTKAALIPFIRAANATAIIEKADAAIKAHPSFVQARSSVSPDSRRDYLMRSVQDADRTIQMALLPVVLTPMEDA